MDPRVPTGGRWSDPSETGVESEDVAEDETRVGSCAVRGMTRVSLEYRGSRQLRQISGSPVAFMTSMVDVVQVEKDLTV